MAGRQQKTQSVPRPPVYARMSGLAGDDVSGGGPIDADEQHQCGFWL
jgi:hypothetical protein